MSTPTVTIKVVTPKISLEQTKFAHVSVGAHNLPIGIQSAYAVIYAEPEGPVPGPDDASLGGIALFSNPRFPNPQDTACHMIYGPGIYTVYAKLYIFLAKNPQVESIYDSNTTNIEVTT